jgi:hypothetical protein
MNNVGIEQIDIDNRVEDFSNEYIAVAVLEHFKTDAVKYTQTGVEVNFANDCIFLCNLISYITNEELLNGLISFFKKIDYLKDADVKFEKFKTSFIESYTDIDLIRIKAIVYSIYSYYDVWMETINPIDENYSNPVLKIEINDRLIKHNLPHILNLLSNKIDILFIKSIESLTIAEQTIEINKAIKIQRNRNHILDTNYFSKSIDYLNENKQFLHENKTSSEKNRKTEALKKNFKDFF